MDIVEYLKEIPAVGYAIAVGVILIAIAQLTGALSDLFDFGKRIFEHATGLRMSKAELRKKTMETVRRLNNLIADRQPHEHRALYSRQLTETNFHEISKDAVEYVQVTMSLYQRDISAEVDEVRFQYSKRGIESEDLDNHQKYTTNTIGLKKISSALSEAAAKL
jgi:hypothetical protein